MFQNYPSCSIKLFLILVLSTNSKICLSKEQANDAHVLLNNTPTEVSKVFKKKWRIAKGKVNNTDLKSFLASNHPALQQWIEDLTFLFLETATAKKSFSFSLSDPQIMAHTFGIDLSRATTWWERNRAKLEKQEPDLGQIIQSISFDYFKPRFYVVGVTPKINMAWTGMTSQAMETIILLQEDQINPVVMLEHLIHESAVLHDTDGYDNSEALKFFRKADQGRREVLPSDLEHLTGLDYPALSISLVSLRALRFENTILSEMEKLFGVNLWERRSFKSRMNSEAECKRVYAHNVRTLGNFSDISPTGEELNQINRKLAEYLPKMNCLQQSTPNFYRVPKHFHRFPGPRCRMGGG